MAAYLKLYFPQLLDWFGEVGSAIVGDFLERWPTLQKEGASANRPENFDG